MTNDEVRRGLRRIWPADTAKHFARTVRTSIAVAQAALYQPRMGRTAYRRALSPEVIAELENRIAELVALKGQFEQAREDIEHALVREGGACCGSPLGFSRIDRQKGGAASVARRTPIAALRRGIEQSG